MAANTKQCSFNTGLSRELTSENRFVYYYNNRSPSLVSQDQCQVKSTRSTSIQLIYECITWEDDYFNPCCGEPQDNGIKNLCNEVQENIRPGIFRAWWTLFTVCRNGPVLYPFQTLFTDCCAGQPELAEPCRAVQQTGAQYAADILRLYFACGYNFNDNFSECANNCRGVNTTDIIAGGAAVFAASALLTTPPLAALGPSVLVSLAAGLLGLGAGAVTAQQLCAGPMYCRRGTQCCLLAFEASRGSFFCPPSCETK